MNPTGRAHGPFRLAVELEVDEVEDRRRWCSRAAACRRIASDLHWPSYSCKAPNGDPCTEHQRPEPGDLRDEVIALAAFGRWIYETRDEVGGVDDRLEAVRTALEQNPGASISEISRLTGSARAYISRVRRVGR